MNVSVVGTGYVGLVTGASFAELGHDVVCHDIDEKKINGLKNGIIPIYEPGLEELVNQNVKKGRLTFTTNMKEAVEFGDIVMSAVGTPPDKDHKADLQYVLEVAKNFAKYLNSYKVFVNKSTVPVGTAEKCRKVIRDELMNHNDGPAGNCEFDVVSNPEFLREGCAIDDIFNPDRIVVGVDTDRAQVLMEKLYHPLVRTGKPLVFCDIKSAEVIKYAANAFLATKISFINEIAQFCEKCGADVKEVSRGIGLDNRIGGKFLHAGIGYGGSCFPKDVRALIQSGLEQDYDFSILKAVDDVNEKQKVLLIQKFKKHFQECDGKTVGIWGLSFKPKTDDLRCAPSVEIIKGLLEMGVKVMAFDPVARENFERQYPELTGNENFSLVDDAFSAIEEADCLMVLTEWNEFRGVDLDDVKNKMRGDLVLDGRNIYDPKEVVEAGLKYEGVGRGIKD